MFLALIFSFGLQAKCLYQVDSSGSEVSWVAYKTPEKVGVKGEFKKFDFASPKSKTYKELVEGAVYSIHTDSVKTGDKGRDSRLTKHFFKVMETPYIRGYVTNFNVERSLVDTQLTLNGITKTVQLNYKRIKETIELSGKIDILEFSLNQALKAINKACYALHKGKTWSDVDLLIKVKTKKNCD